MFESVSVPGGTPAGGVGERDGGERRARRIGMFDAGTTWNASRAGWRRGGAPRRLSRAVALRLVLHHRTPVDEALPAPLRTRRLVPFHPPCLRGRRRRWGALDIIFFVQTQRVRGAGSPVRGRRIARGDLGAERSSSRTNSGHHGYSFTSERTPDASRTRPRVTTPESAQPTSASFGKTNDRLEFSRKLHFLRMAVSVTIHEVQNAPTKCSPSTVKNALDQSDCALQHTGFNRRKVQDATSVSDRRVALKGAI